MPFTIRTKVVLNDNEQYTFEQLIRLQKPVEPVEVIDGQPPQATTPIKFTGYGVTKFGLIVEQALTHPFVAGHERVLQLRLSTGDIVETTPEQEFYLQLGIPTQAKDLQVGDRPLVQMGGEIEIKHIDWVNGAQDVFHLTSETGNYMLASGLIVTHQAP